MTLGQELSRRGAAVTFIARQHEPGWYQRVLDAGFDLRLLPAPSGDRDGLADEDYAAWLGVDVAQDAEETLEELVGQEYGLLIVDHYGLDAQWERQVQPSVGSVMAIDDLQGRAHEVDVLLDQNLSAHERTADGADSSGALRALLGPRYALLDPSYRHARALQVPPSAAARRGVVYFGGADPAGLTLTTLRVLADREFDHLEIDVVLGTATAQREEVERLANPLGRIRIHSKLLSLAGLLLGCDFAVGGAGATSWERACLGVPAAVVSLAANQVDNAEALERAGAARYLGGVDEVTEQDFRDAIGDLVTDESSRRRMAACASKLVDGFGVLRVAEALLPSRPHAVTVRPVQPMSDDARAGEAPGTGRTSVYELMVDDLPVGVAEARDYTDELRIALNLDEVVDGRGWGHNLQWAVASAHRARQDALAAISGTRTPIGVEAHRGRGRSVLRVGVASNARSWINEHLAVLTGEWLQAGHLVDWRHDAAEVADSDVCFYLSYGRIVRPEILARHGHNLVVHASDLPRGRGWSPMTWSILAGERTVTVSLLEAVEEVDAGVIYLQRQIELDRHELVDQWRRRQVEILFELCCWAVENLDDLEDHARAQHGEPTWLPRRRPEDSELDPHRTLAEQFDLLRVVDNDSYPAFFEHRGHRYRLTIDLDGPKGS